jgi:transcriptional regulator with XRE-family HTH domain
MVFSAREAGEKLAAYLKRARKQQKELAAELGVEPSYISRMVKGHINWTTGQYFGQIASRLDLQDHEIKELNPAAVVEITSPARPAESGLPGEIPQALLEAAELYRAIDPRIADPAVQLALSRAGYFGGGPETPQDWIRYFNDVRDWIGRVTN